MVYTINVADVKNRELENAPKNLVATVTVEFDNILKISGINIKEKPDGMLYVEMPKRANYYSRSVINSRTKYIAIPSNKEFAKELYSNIIKTYVDGKHQFISNVGEPEQTHYKINAYPSGTIDCDGIINIELEDSVKKSDGVKGEEKSANNWLKDIKTMFLLFCIAISVVCII